MNINLCAHRWTYHDTRWGFLNLRRAPHYRCHKCDATESFETNLRREIWR